MSEKAAFPKTLQEAIKYFADADVAFAFMKEIRFPGGKVACPRCGSETVSFISTRKLWTCKECTTKKQFTIRVGTILEDSPIGFDKWICAFWLIANAKNGISSYEIHRSLGVTQRTGWFMLQRIRLAMQNGTIVKMSGTVEADECFVGGLSRNMHKDKRAQKIKGGGAYGKTIVMGLLERGTEACESRVRAAVIKNTRKASLRQEIQKHVEAGSELHTDSWIAYQQLDADYIHKFVDHAVEYVRDNVHTNGLENFWSLLKRTIKGTYVAVNSEHLHRYLDEQAFRYNERKNEDGDKGRFLKAITGMLGKRLTYAELISSEGCLS